MGLRRRIGDGKSTFIYRDRWVPRLSTFKVSSPPVFDENSTVDLLLRDRGSWDIPLVRQSFFEEEAEAILSLPLSNSGLDDSFLWHFGKFGDYSVKSGYWNESVLHALWQCPSLKGLRYNTCISFLGKSWGSASFFDFVLACKDNVSLPDIELLCGMWWRIWYRRNQLVHSSVLLPESDIYEWARDFIGDFWQANQQSIGGSSRQSGVASWEAPAVGVYKINTDAALCAQKGVYRNTRSPNKLTRHKERSPHTYVKYDWWYDGGSIIVAGFLVAIVSAVSNFKQKIQFERLSNVSSDIEVEVVRDGRLRPVSIFDIVAGL
ncbi:hypothetical protein EZV62_007198 [Acer yangbiense]|uniref:Reverse transcriptase zinc-binding domain-containing protein n=1 Tax=Acer yangbiense TaxID=1000413 RepID=A0A5C7I8M0_9ROSI|nr:hypothetical protein EZV62_007198 [Acer yangbiense]